MSSWRASPRVSSPRTRFGRVGDRPRSSRWRPPPRRSRRSADSCTGSAATSGSDWEIAVLTGVSLEKSGVWRQRTFGNEVLWNGQVDDTGQPTGRSADQVEPQPDDVILCDSIRRFKGLERPVVILVELSADDPKLNPLLYVGISRARQHLVLVVPTDVAERLRE
jgi:UvrD-like helicase C-terminal domain